MTAGARHARANGTTVILNPSPAAPLPDDLIECVDVLVVNETEAAQLGAATLARVPDVVTTLGARGATLRGPGGVQLRSEPPAVEVVDTTGAGDAFAGTLRPRAGTSGGRSRSLGPAPPEPSPPPGRGPTRRRPAPRSTPRSSGGDPMSWSSGTMGAMSHSNRARDPRSPRRRGTVAARARRPATPRLREDQWRAIEALVADRRGRWSCSAPAGASPRCTSSPPRCCARGAPVPR